MSASNLGPGPTSNTFFSQRLRLQYVDYGTVGKPLLVLVHGGRDHARNWDAVADRLRERYHVIAPDLRGHGDSQWAIGGQYAMPDYVLDLAQLLRHVGEKKVRLVGHSLGGAICLHYTGCFPESVERLCAIEGMGPPPEMIKDRPVEERWRDWITTTQGLAERNPREYSTLNDAADRMQEANPHLTEEMARHLTINGTMRLENGNYVWKFDNYVRAWGPHRYDNAAVERLWSLIDCPVLLVRGSESWASNPVSDGRAKHIRDCRYAEIAKAGHWVHHDRYHEFMSQLEPFLDGSED
jgi:pimeloyl-ACP methyl ester carboxylesterase